MAKTLILYPAVENTCWGGGKLNGPLFFKSNKLNVHIYSLSGSYGLFVCLPKTSNLELLYADNEKKILSLVKYLIFG